MMSRGRKTTLKERIDILEGQTAEKYDKWYNNLQAKGIEGLKDGHDYSKSEDAMTEVEKLEAENRILKAEIEKTELEALFLKKVKEIERVLF